MPQVTLAVNYMPHHRLPLHQQTCIVQQTATRNSLHASLLVFFHGMTALEHRPLELPPGITSSRDLEYIKS